MNKEWVKVYSSDQLHLAELIKSVLIENDINAINFNKKSTPYLFGEIEIFVQKEDVVRAKYIISKYNE